jgi:hypothetical protein
MGVEDGELDADADTDAEPDNSSRSASDDDSDVGWRECGADPGVAPGVKSTISAASVTYPLLSPLIKSTSSAGPEKSISPRRTSPEALVAGAGEGLRLVSAPVPVPAPLLSSSTRRRSFSGRSSSVSKHRMHSSTLRSSHRGSFPKRVKNESTVLPDSVDPRESSMLVISTCDSVLVSSTSYCCFECYPHE